MDGRTTPKGEETEGKVHQRNTCSTCYRCGLRQVRGCTSSLRGYFSGRSHSDRGSRPDPSVRPCTTTSRVDTRTGGT